MTKKTTRTARPADDELSPKEQLFVASYSAHFNAARAARDAGYSPKTAKQIGHELLQRADVKAAIDAILEARKQQYAISLERTLEEAARVAQSNIQDLLDDDGQLIPVHRLPRSVAASIASIEVGFTTGRRGRKGNKRTREQVVKVKLWDKPRALELLGKHQGIGGEGAQAPTGPSIIFPPGTRIAIE